jgi:hypothetical protein
MLKTLIAFLRFPSQALSFKGGFPSSISFLCFLNASFLSFFSLPAMAQTNVGTYDALQAAIGTRGSGTVVTLTADISGTTPLNIGRNLTLDLDGYSLTINFISILNHSLAKDTFGGSPVFRF